MSSASPALKRVGKLVPERLAKPLRRLRDRAADARIAAILAQSEAPDTRRAEKDFERLYAEFPAVPEYGYDNHSLWKRGLERALAVAGLPTDPIQSLRVLEVGCGDALAAVFLSLHGHRVTVSDMADWRDARARQLEFCQCVLEDGLPLPSGSFDLLYSYNSFEHFRDPGACFAELTRLAAPGATLHLSFGPIYASPWGLHAYSLRLPYPQYLFSPDFLTAKLAEIGIYDLGQKLTALQPLNQWTVRQFSALWSAPDWQVLRKEHWAPRTHLDMVLRYPECFTGRGLTLEDIATQMITVTLRRLPRAP